MIVEVGLKGFQSHVNTVINLQSGLNVVTGPSDSGKTAVIRAIRWVAFNEPQGEAFVNENVGESEVKLSLQNGYIITKTRRKGKTTYVVQHDETDTGSTFEKSEVPLEVTRLLGIEKHSFGDFETALNFSFQLDAPFLISETASAGAKILGKLAGTESVDLAIKGVSKDTYATRNKRSQAEKDIERINGSLLEYLNIDDAKQSLETAEMIFEQVEANHMKFESLKENKHQYNLAREKINEFFNILQKLMHVPELEEDLKDIEKSQQRYDSLLHLYSDGNRLVERISKLGQELEAYKEIESASEHLSSISLDTDRLTNNITLRQLYQKHIGDVKVATETLERTKDIDSVAGSINDTELLINTMKNLRITQGECESTLNRLNALQTRLNMFKDLVGLEDNLTAVESDEKRLAALKELQKEFQLNKAWTDDASARLDMTTHELFEAEHVIQEAWQEAGGVCPLCESAVCDHG